MIVALASVNFMNKNVAFNLSQIDTYACEAAAQRVDVICFGESFFQGFESLSWQYEKDKDIAISQNSPEVAVIRQMTLDYHIDIMFGYFEHANESLYSSYALIADGHFVHNYRRVSRGWKKYWSTDYHYQEGTDSQSFLYRDMECKIALCGGTYGSSTNVSLAVRFSFGQCMLITLQRNGIKILNSMLRKPLLVQTHV